jgi:AhpD family alkylhydroperoxidase
VLFIGGGYVSFEFAHLAARADAEVIVLDRGERPLKAFDADLVTKLVEPFGGLASAATASKTLDTKMAVAISIAVHCEGCVAFHTKMAHQNGATREELLETVALAIYMGGGPAAVYGADALAPSTNSRVPPGSAVVIRPIEETGMPATGKSPIDLPFPRHAAAPPAVHRQEWRGQDLRRRRQRGRACRTRQARAAGQHGSRL